MHLPIEAGRHREGGACRRRGNNLVSVPLERAARDVTHGPRVLDEQHGLRTADVGRLFVFLRGWRRLIIIQWKADLERCPFARLAIRPDETAALLDDPVNSSHPQPRSLSRFLGCEKRLEDLGACSLVHADTGVSHSQHGVTPVWRGPVSPGVMIVELDDTRFYGELAAGGHRIPRVHHQVHDYLFQLTWIDVNDTRR